jgi:hypothetical protein
MKIMKNSKGYPRKALIWVQYKHLEPLTEEDCKLQYDLWMHYLVENDYMTENQKPPLNQVDGYKVAKTWSEYLPQADFELLYKKSHLSEAYSNIKSFFRHSKNHLYSVYPVGKAPVEVVKKYNLCKYLLADDAAVYNVTYPEPEGPVIDVDASKLDGDVDAGSLAEVVDNKLPAEPKVGAFGPSKTKMTPRSIAGTLEKTEDKSANKDDPSEKKIKNTTSEPAPKRARVIETRSSKGNAK